MTRGYSHLPIDSLSLVYFPQLGFLVTIPLTEECSVELLKSFSEMELQFATDKFAYLKDSKTRGSLFQSLRFM